jgi:hypothetical protein
MSFDDPVLLQTLAGRAELAGADLRTSGNSTAWQIASVRWRGPAARAFDAHLSALLLLVRRTADDLDAVAAALRRESGRRTVPR